MTERRPDRSLLTYYILTSFLLGPLFPVLLIPLYFKYHTLRYVFEDQGISMSWGIIFRREISLTYARIQDIHLSSNIVERWLGLARVQVQTASGSAEAEMTIEGLKDFEPIRDFLYSRMRGIAETPSLQATVAPVRSDDEDLGQLLHTIAQEVRALRLSLEGRDKIDS